MASCAHNCGYSTPVAKRMSKHIRDNHLGVADPKNVIRREFRGHKTTRGKKK